MLSEYFKKTENYLIVEDINIDFYDDLVEFMTNEKIYALNTIGKHIGVLRVFIAAANKKGYKIDTTGFTKPSEQSDTIYLNEDELMQIYNYDFKNNKRLERVRDIFIFAANTGLRFSDLVLVDEDSIKGNRIVLEQEKTERKINNPCNWVAMEILEKYEYNLPIDISNQRYNDYIKDVCEEVKINDIIKKGITKGGKRIVKMTSIISKHTFSKSTIMYRKLN